MPPLCAPSLAADAFCNWLGGFIFRSNHSQWFCEQSAPCAHFVTVRSRWLQKKTKRKVNTPFSPMGLAKTSDREGFCDGARQLCWQSKGGVGGLRASVCVSGEGCGAAFVLWQRKLPTRMTMTPTNHLLLTLFLTYHLSRIDTPIFHLNTFHRGTSRTPKQYFTQFPWFLTFINFLPWSQTGSSLLYTNLIKAYENVMKSNLTIEVWFPHTMSNDPLAFQ